MSNESGPKISGRYWEETQKKNKGKNSREHEQEADDKAENRDAYAIGGIKQKSDFMVGRRTSDTMEAIEEAERLKKISEIKRKIKNAPDPHEDSRGSLYEESQQRQAEKRAPKKEKGFLRRLFGASNEAKKIEKQKSKIDLDRRNVGQILASRIAENYNEGKRGVNSAKERKKGKSSSKPTKDYGFFLNLLNAKTTKRNFLLKVVPTAGFTWLASKFPLDSHPEQVLMNIFRLNKENEARYEAVQEDEEKAIEEKEMEITPEQIEKEKDNEKINEEIFRYERGKYYKYGAEQAQIQEEYWYNRYSKRKPEVRKAYANIMSWMEADIEGEKNLKTIFQENFIGRLEEIRKADEKKRYDKLSEEEKTAYDSLTEEEKQKRWKLSDKEKNELYLSYVAQIIRESSGNPFAESCVHAAGMHQFMKETAAEEGLKMKGNCDERYDPVASAKAYCTLMIKFFLRYGKNMDLARQGYNGVVGSYWKAAGRDGNKMSIEGLYGFIEAKLNSMEFFHEVENGGTIRDVAKIYGISPESVKAENSDLDFDTELSKRQRVRLPDVENVERVLFRDKAKKYGENTNYLPAIRAIKRILEEEAENRTLPENFDRIIVKKHITVGRTVGKDSAIEVKSGDTLYGIAKKYGITSEKLSDLNGLKPKSKGIYMIYPKQKLYVERATCPTLMDIAGGNKKECKRLWALNPKIKDKNLPIPEGTVIRV